MTKTLAIATLKTDNGLSTSALSPKIPGFNHEKCVQRARIDAARFHASAFPCQLRGAVPGAFNDGFTVTKTIGKLAYSVDEALDLINASISPDNHLSPEKIHLLTLEAANSRFIPSYSEYLGETSLKNFAEDGAAGVSFMNSHRTGGMSAPAELPFGQSYSGAYQIGFNRDGMPMQRTLIGVYMLSGIHPNGANGPDTDTLYSMAMARVIRDVSVGFVGGDEYCDVCGNIMDYYDERAWSEPDSEGYRSKLCRHVPGTHRNMTPEQISIQKAKDPLNVKGLATYTVQEAGLSEVSAVYDGAVPGAGIRQVMALLQSQDLDTESKNDLLKETHDLWGDLLPFDLLNTISNKLINGDNMKLPTIGGNRNRAAVTNPPLQSANPAPAAQQLSEAETLQQQIAQRDAEIARLRSIAGQSQERTQSISFEQFQELAGRNLSPAVMDRFTDLFEGAQAIDSLNIQGQDGSELGLQRHAYGERGERLETLETVSLSELVRDAVNALGQHGAAMRVVPTEGRQAQLKAQEAPATPDPKAVDQEYVARATAALPLGRAGQVMLANRAAQNGTPNNGSGPWVPGRG